MTSILPKLKILLPVIPLLFLAIFFFYPLANIIAFGLTHDAISQLLGKLYYGKVFWFTFWQAALSTALTLAFGLPAAYLFARYQFWGKQVLRALVTVPFVLPTVVVAASFRALLGPIGPINNALVTVFNLELAPIRLEQTLSIILIAHMYYNMAVVIRLVGGFWANLSPRLPEAARTLGASRWQAFLEITFPLLRPAILSATVLIFLFTFTSFGVILILGGPSFSTVETEIYRQYVNFLNPEIAALLALIQIIFTFALLSIYARWQRKSVIPLDFIPHSANLKHPQTRLEKILVAGTLIGLTVFMLSPLLALIFSSFLDRQGEFTVAYYQALPELRRGSVTFIPPLQAIRNSIGYAVLTMFLAALLGTFSAVFLAKPAKWRGWIDPIFMLPLGVSAVALGFGYIITMGPLRTSPLLVLIAHTLVALPFVVRSILPVLQGIRPGLRESASILGASPFRVWREVDLPIMGRALLVAAVFAFTVSMGEFGATSFIVRPNSEFLTMPVAIQRYLSQPGALNFGQALAMSSILMVICASGFIAIERFRYNNIGEF
jgi:thiamine transport system permease protein